MNRIRRISAVAAIAMSLGAGSFTGLGTALADPANPADPTNPTNPPNPANPAACGTPDTPACASTNPMTPEQQCELIALRTGMPCNWLGVKVPRGTPGSWG